MQCSLRYSHIRISENISESIRIAHVKNTLDSSHVRPNSLDQPKPGAGLIEVSDYFGANSLFAGTEGAGPFGGHGPFWTQMAHFLNEEPI